MTSTIARKLLLLTALAIPVAMYPPLPDCGPCAPDPPQKGSIVLAQ